MAGGGGREKTKQTRKLLKKVNKQKKRGEGESAFLSLVSFTMGIITASKVIVRVKSRICSFQEIVAVLIVVHKDLQKTNMTPFSIYF